LITTDTGGIGEAVGDTALVVPVEDPDAIAAALDQALSLPEHEREAMELRAREHALQFDRGRVFDQLMARLAPAPAAPGVLSRL
jgi:glycosyltransferase involved in cell wall biosynthesis